MELYAIDRSNWTMKVVGYAPELSFARLDQGWTHAPRRRGSRFVPGKHEQGTEVSFALELAGLPRACIVLETHWQVQIKAITYSAMQIHEREAASDKPAEIFVIVDI